jgi:hypothetical protein
MADFAYLTRRGWDMSQPADVCMLDHSDFVPGYRKVLTGADGVRREIVLCPEDAMVLEAGAADGDYAGALTPEDSRAGEWPWMELRVA